jgi:hypothetical protein
MAAPSSPWTCLTCQEEFSSTATTKCCTIMLPGETTSYHVCAPCLRTQFSSVVASETAHPVKWGASHTLHPRQFPGAFDMAFVRAYETKEREYLAPATMRVYCECGSFVAPMVAPEEKSSWLSLASSKLCWSCEARWCLRCAQRCGGWGVPHACIPERRLGERRLALGALQRGKDYQECPGGGCGRVVELAEACNQMSCQCGVSFCYICGKEAEAGSDHWLRELGGCPRWGQRGSEREIYDNDEHDVVANDDDDDTDDAGAEELVPWERGDGELTTFNFTRWAWQAAMAEGTVYALQLDVMFGIALDTVERQVDIIDRVRRAMEMYNPVSRSGVTEEQWQALVMNQNDAADHWLRALETFVWNGQGTAAEHLDGPLLDFIPRHVFNMAVAADREAAALWVREANERTVAFVTDAENDDFPGSAVFDVGPGGIPGESWNIREMDMFDDLPALGFFKLAGGALLVIPRPELVMGVEPADDLVQRLMMIQNNAQAGQPEQLVQDEEPAPDTQIRDDEYVTTIRAGEQYRRRRHDLVLAELKHAQPLYHALIYPFSFLISDVFVGEVNQRGYDHRYGLEFRGDLKIPGSWPADGEGTDLIYSGMLVPGWYSQDVWMMRCMFFFACLLSVMFCHYEWKNAVWQKWLLQLVR